MATRKGINNSENYAAPLYNSRLCELRIDYLIEDG